MTTAIGKSLRAWLARLAAREGLDLNFELAALAKRLDGKRADRVTGQLFLLFPFLFAFFLWIELSFFLLFPLAFVFFSLITHICFSLFESGFPRWLLPTPLFDVRASRQPPGKRVPRQLPCPLLVKQSF